MQPGSSGQGPPGFDPVRHQNLAFRQGMQQQQQQQDQLHQQQPQQLNFQPGAHPMLNPNPNNLPNFPPSSSSGPQMQMRVQNPQAQPQNPVHQAYFQFALQQQQQMQQQQSPRANILAQQTGNPSGNPNPNSKMHEMMSMQRNNNSPNNPFMARPSQPQTGNPNPNANSIPNQQMMNQYQMMQEWAKAQNLDLSIPANMNLLAQVFNSRMASQQQKNPNPNPNESNISNQHQQMQQAQQHMVPSPSGGSEGSASASHGTINTNPLTEISGQRPPAVQLGQAGSSSGAGSEAMPVQFMRQQEQGRPPAVNASGGETGAKQSNFTKQQLHVLKAQILAFRRLKRGDNTLPAEVLEAIMAPPLDPTHQQPHPPTAPQPHIPVPVQVSSPPAQPLTPQPNRGLREEQPGNNSTQQIPTNEKAPVLIKPPLPKPETPILSPSAPAGTSKDLPAHHAGPNSSNIVQNTVQNNTPVIVKSEQEAERAVPIQRPQSAPSSDNSNEKGKAVLTADTAGVNNDPIKKPMNNSSNNTAAAAASTSSGAPAVPRKYNGPIFDFPSFTRKNEAVVTGNYNSNLTLKYDVKDLLAEEGPVILRKRRADNLKKISGLLAINLERKRIRPDLILKLQIEEKKLKLLEIQSRVRLEVDQEQQEIMQMPDRPYRKFVRQCERQRTDLLKQVQQMQRAGREKFLKSVFQWRKKFLEAHWGVRDGRSTRNRGIAKYHERMLKDFAKRKDDDRNKRMEALKNNDVDRYRQMLLEQQLSVPGDAAQRYNVLSSFLSQTEEYLLKLGGKITSAKNTQEVDEAAAAAASAARAQGLSEEEVRTAAACAREEVMIRNRFSEMNAPREAGTGSSANKYYNLAHAVNERVFRQPSMLKAGTLRDYQLVGLQWMLSLYNNKLNGILADEMGLGKTVQVMALIAFLMEFKGNYGPHLIIVPNAVLVNWKSELLHWLPSVSCIFYVGTKDTRAKLFTQEVLAMKFNVLVTTYEFVMYDRSKLSKIDWKYIIIDEAQRMKDRESVLARDLDRYRCQRRLLLTGTPLQNDLKELWSLLNLLLPEVFDNKRAFQEWFAKPFQRDGGPSNPEEDDWLETEKKVIVIHRLHQILEPFMLRRRVEDVEGSLPRKESIVLRCKMSAMQSAVYNWIKSTGTIRVDPEDEAHKMQKSPLYQPKAYKNLNNKCMELRKVCNHPILSYPSITYFAKDFVVRSCGKLWILDRILIKLHQAGHRVLLFSTMTKLLDIMEEYLQWRRLVYRRIDGTTSLEDREHAIVDFNAPNSDCFIFLLSIRAAGRGLNLQSADTVVIYDPDPNPQNEEQAVARAHRIGQTREVKVIYLEAVVDKVSSYQKEDDSRQGGSGADFEDDLIGKDRYMASIESLIRSNIQQYKIDMADEVINAGRFDQRTTHEERRMTLETLLHDDERNQETVHDVPSLQEVNRMIARSEEEVEMFDQMDEEFDWPGDMVKHNQVPKWLRTSTDEVDNVVDSLSKKKKGLTSKVDEINNSVENSSGRRARVPKSQNPKYSIYREIDSDEDESEEEEEGNPSNAQEEGEESGESEEEEPEKETKEEEEEEDEEEEYNGVKDETPGEKDNEEEEEEEEEEGEPASNVNGDYLYEDQKDNNINDERYEEEETHNGSGYSSGGARRLPLPATPSESSQKFGSLSALDAFTKRTPDDLEDGEIALSTDSRTEFRQIPNNYEDQLQLQLQQDDLHQEEPQQIPAPKLKRKRSMRVPRFNTNINFDTTTNNNVDNSIMRFNAQPKEEAGVGSSVGKQKRSGVQEKKKRLSSGGNGSNNSSVAAKSGRTSNLKDSKGGWNKSGAGSGSGSGSGSRLRAAKMSESTQRKCKNVITKLYKRIDRDGHQIIPVLSDWWRRNVKATFMVSGKTIHDLRRIEQRVDSFEYGSVMDFIKDLQLMLKNVVRYHNNNYSLWQIRNEADRFHSLFFEIMKIAFPDSDFHEAKKSIDFSTLFASATPTSNNTQTKQRTQAGKSDSDRPVSNKSQGSGSKSQRDPVPHPGDLVVCKKKRKDREKPSMLKSPSSSNRIGLLNTGKMGTISPAGTSSGKGTRSTFQRDSHNLGWGQGSSNGDNVGIGDVQWAKPVKRMRSDTGKRRPSHL